MMNKIFFNQSLKFIKIIVILALFYFFATDNFAYGWWFGKSDDELLSEALVSQKPKTVEKSLDRQIEKRNYIAVQRLRLHARSMMRQERVRLNGNPAAKPADIQKRLAPWEQIEQKADRFFKKRTVQ